MKTFTTAVVAVVGASTLVIAPTEQPPPPRPMIELTAASAQPPNVVESLARLDLVRFVSPPSATQPIPAPPPPPVPAPTAAGFEDLIISTYHAVEPWVRYGFELATYAAGWVPWVGWLSPQIMIFYNFGERIVESLVVNSANWLWGPLPFGQGLANIAQDSLDALVQLGIDEWNFWLPPLPPLPPLPLGTQADQTEPEPVDTVTAAESTPPQPDARREPRAELSNVTDDGAPDGTQDENTDQLNAADGDLPEPSAPEVVEPADDQLPLAPEPEEENSTPRPVKSPVDDNSPSRSSEDQKTLADTETEQPADRPSRHSRDNTGESSRTPHSRKHEEKNESDRSSESAPDDEKGSAATAR